MIGGPAWRDIPDKCGVYPELSEGLVARDSPKRTSKVPTRTWGEGVPRIICDSYLIDFKISSLFPCLPRGVLSIFHWGGAIPLGTGGI